MRNICDWSNLALPLASGDQSGGVPVWWKAILYAGKFHPPSVHFPIALIMVAALLETASWCKPRTIFAERLRMASAINLLIGAASAMVAMALGWMLAARTGFEPELKPVLFWHRWMGTLTALLACITVCARS